MDSQDMRDCVDRYVEAFESASLDIIRELYADDAVVEDPVGTDPHHGIDAILEFYRTALESGAKLKRSGQVRCAGSSAAFPFTVNMPGMEMHVIDVFDFNEDGKVAQMRAYWSGENVVAS